MQFTVRYLLVLAPKLKSVANLKIYQNVIEKCSFKNYLGYHLILAQKFNVVANLKTSQN